MATAADRANLQKLYIAYFGRAAEPAGLNFWMNQVDQGVSLATIGNTFAALPEAQARFSFLAFPQLGDKNAFITSVYQALFNRAPDAAGLAFWAGRVNTGNPGQTIFEIINNAGAGDIDVVNNRVTVANSYTDKVVAGAAYSSSDSITILNTVTGTASTVTAAQATISALSSETVGSTFTLTTASDNVSGTANADTINASLVYASGGVTVDSTSTLSAADSITGGAGTDTLNVTITGGNAGTTFAPALISGVEILNLRNVSGQTNSLDASTISGLTGIYADRATSAVTLTNVADGATVGVKGDGTVTNGAFNFGYKTDSAAISLAISGGVTGGAITGNSTTGTDAATAATITSTGAANTVGTVDLLTGASTLTSLTINATTNLKGQIAAQTEGDFAASSTLTVTGAATTVELTAALANNIKTVDASGMTTGGLKATVGTGTEDIKGGTGVDTITLNTGVKTATFGAGDDVVTTAAVASTTAGTISGGDGTDTLVVAATAHVDTSAERAVYTSFETINNATTAAIAADGFAAATALISSGVQGGFTGMSATQAANITNTAVQTGGTTFALATATGTSDVLSITTKHGTATTAADLATLTVNGFETFNITSSSGNVDETNAEATLVSFAAATDLKNINVAGAFAVNLILDNTSKAVTVANTLTGTAAMRVEGEVIKGSSITTTANGDTIETALAAVAGVQGDFVTYDAGAGDDAISTSLTGLNNTNAGAASLKIEGGAGTDTVTFAAADTTFSDAHFQYVTGVEKLVLASNTTVSLTSGGFFDTNFKGSGADITAANIANGSTATVNLSSFTGVGKIALTTAADGASAADNVTVTTGTGADDVTVTASSWVGAAGAAGALSVTTGAGNDKISVTTGTLLAVTGANAVTINAGTGADTITVVHDNAGSDLGNFTFVIADGDSLAASRDKITGFDVGTAAKIADTLDLQGTPTVTANTAGTNGTDSGTIKSHAITSGIITFDDVDTFASAVVVNEANLSDVLAYLAANITTAGDTVAFAYDSDSSGTADATIVFQQGTNDTVVELVGVVGTSITATNATTAGLIDLA